MPDESLESVTQAYNAIHKGILDALSFTNDPGTVANLMANDKAAYAAYNTALARALNPNDPTMTNMLEQLGAASNAIDTSLDGITNIETLASQIDRAVGVLAKIATIAG